MSLVSRRLGDDPLDGDFGSAESTIKAPCTLMRTAPGRVIVVSIFLVAGDDCGRDQRRDAADDMGAMRADGAEGDEDERSALEAEPVSAAWESQSAGSAGSVGKGNVAAAVLDGGWRWSACDIELGIIWGGGSDRRRVGSDKAF